MNIAIILKNSLCRRIVLLLGAGLDRTLPKLPYIAFIKTITHISGLPPVYLNDINAKKAKNVDVIMDMGII